MTFPTIISITDETLDVDSLLAKITSSTAGAAAIFTGIVRGSSHRNEPRETLYLEYEAYRDMAELKMNQIAQEIRRRWPLVEGIALVQRIGRMYPKTPTILIICTAAHRDSGIFDAVHYGIDRVKQIVPVWKKEVGPGGEYWVEGDYLPKPGE